MVLTEIEQQYIQPLSTAEKEQLLLDIQRMLVDEEIAEYGDQMICDMMPSGTVLSIDSPGICANDADIDIAIRLQQFLTEHEHEISV